MRACRFRLFGHFWPVGSVGFEPTKGVPQLIYSQSPLATWLTTQEKNRYRFESATVISTIPLANLQLEPTMGIEPITYHLQGGCSAN
jgi:hypothetical protein